MIRNWQKMTGLGLMFLALGGLATWDEWQTKKDVAEKDVKGLLMSIKPADVTGIVFHSAADSENGDKSATLAGTPSKTVDATFKLVDGFWTMLTPIQTLADQQAIVDLLKSISEYKTETDVATGKDKWPAFGLANPRRMIELETKDGKKTTLYVGINAPVGFSAYTATSASDVVFSGSQYIATSTGKSMFDLRQKRLLNLKSADVTRMTLGLANEKVSALKKDGVWTLTSPIATAADTASMNNLIDDITGLKATEFLDSPDKAITTALAGKKIFAEIELVADKSTSTLRIETLKGKLYAALSGTATVYELPGDNMSKLNKTSKDLRDKKIFSFQSAEVEKVSIDGDFFHIIANEWYTAADSAKFGADGKFTGKPEDQPKPTNHIRNLVVDLEYAKAEDVFGPTSPEAKKLPLAPLHRINLTLKAAVPTISIDAWLTKENPDMLYLRTSGQTQVFKAKKIVLAGISPAPATPQGQGTDMPATPDMPAMPDVPTP